MKVIEIRYETIYEPNDVTLDARENILCEDTMSALRQIEAKALTDSFDDNGTKYTAKAFNLISAHDLANNVIHSPTA